MKYKNFILIIILLVLLNFAILSLINLYKSNYMLNYDDESIQVHVEVEHTNLLGFIDQIVTSENGYYLIISEFIFAADDTYYLEYYTLEDRFQWSVKLPDQIDNARSSILAQSEDYVIIDYPRFLEPFSAPINDLNKSFLLFNVQERIFTDLIIHELKPYSEYIYNNTVIRYLFDSQYSGIIKDNQLILVESKKLFDLPIDYDQPQYDDIRLITYDLSVNKLINIFVIKENTGNALLSAEIQRSAGTSLTIVIRNVLSSIPVKLEIESYEINHVSGKVVQKLKIERISCNISCDVYAVSNSDVTIIEKESFMSTSEIPQKFSRLKIGNKDDPAIYIWDPLYQDIFFNGLVVHKELILLYGFTEKEQIQYNAFIGFLDIKNSHYNLRFIDIQRSNWHSSQISSLAMNPKNQLFIAVNALELQNDTQNQSLKYKSFIYMIFPIQDPKIEFLENYPLIPNVISSALIMGIFFLINWYIKRKKNKIVGTEIYPEIE